MSTDNHHKTNMSVTISESNTAVINHEYNLQYNYIQYYILKTT